MLTDSPEYQTYRALRRSGQPHSVAASVISQMVDDPAIVAELEAEHARRQQAIFELSEPGFAAAGYDGPGDYDGSLTRDRHWPLFRDQLEAKGLGDAATQIETAADRIVSLLPNPNAGGALKTRGLVLGYVQSGKTTNFTALMAKAADYGYQIFVVLAGVHNSLRSQTQLRLENDLLDLGGLRTQWWNPTTFNDFRGDPTPPGFYFNDDERRGLIVIKKNVAPMRKLNDWLDNADLSLKARLSLLVIDDEADQASLNAASSNNRKTAVHRELTRLLSFGPSPDQPRVAYVGYTATPFANLLVDPGDFEDLYPRDFVVDLPKPAGYNGAEDLFGRAEWDDDNDMDGLPVLRRIPESDVPAVTPPKSKDDLGAWRPSLPPSLQSSVRWFLLASAARRAIDGRVKHSSMLIHTSARTQPQCLMGPPVQTLLHEFRREWDQDRSAFRDMWDEEMRILPASDLGERAVAFAGLESTMTDVLADVVVRVDNSKNCTERLSYPEDDPQTVIAIGGNTLSRGLTLEGLVTSYFLRSASAYDTLLQMGRWFGFRPGYRHLQRIWMTDELQSWFADLASVEDEIRRDIRRYEDGVSTPEDMAVRIRTHPQMSVTSAARMRSAVTQLANFSDTRLQTTHFDVRDEETLSANRENAKRLLADARASATSHGWRAARWVAEGVPHDFIRSFLRDHELHAKDLTVNVEGLQKHMDLEAQHVGGEARWNVVVMGRGRAESTLDLGLGKPIGLIGRRRMHVPDLDHAYIKALAGSNDHRVDIGGAPSGKALYRSADEPPLLVLYPLDPQQDGSEVKQGVARAPLNAVSSPVGLMIVVPQSKRPGAQQAVSYVTADLSSLGYEEEDDLGDSEDEE